MLEELYNQQSSLSGSSMGSSLGGSLFQNASNQQNSASLGTKRSVNLFTGLSPTSCAGEKKRKMSLSQSEDEQEKRPLRVKDWGRSRIRRPRAKAATIGAVGGSKDTNSGVGDKNNEGVVSGGGVRGKGDNGGSGEKGGEQKSPRDQIVSCFGTGSRSFFDGTRVVLVDRDLVLASVALVSCDT